jgi:hypothetical protein
MNTITSSRTITGASISADFLCTGTITSISNESVRAGAIVRILAVVLASLVFLILLPPWVRS